MRDDGASLLARAGSLFGLAGRGPDEAFLGEVGEYPLGVLLRRVGHCVEHDFGVVRGLVGVVNAREVLDLPLARLAVHALRVARLAHVERRSEEHTSELQSRFGISYA